ncbi:MAG: Rpn family recombination-promoting nuclease/putative transposase [Chloroflexi bacterium]|nr:Rpn family recombination-promoting nuclease/putative transposase [Chloroflexota bacterium]
MQASRGPRPFDVATRQLIDRDPAAWLTWIGLPVDGPVVPLDSEVSTVLAEVDKVLQVGGPHPWLAHLELQTSHDPRLPLRLLEYHALLLHRHEQPVASAVVLLRPQADGPEMTGELLRADPVGELSIRFRYRVLRLWQRPVAEILSGGLGVLPLAPLAAVDLDALPSVIIQMSERIDREASPDVAGNLWAATLLLLGLRYDDRTAGQILRGVRQMRESTTYQAILREGREEGQRLGEELGRAREARRTLLRQGARRFGEPSTDIVSAIENIADLDRLETLLLDLLTAESWSDLLG